MEILKVIGVFVIFFIVAYVVYYFVVTNKYIRSIRGKSKKKRELSTELVFLKNYYKVNVEKIGTIKVLKIVNFINALLIAALVTIVAWIDKIWLKLLLIGILIFPLIWASYYFLAKYLKHLERKRDNV